MATNTINSTSNISYEQTISNTISTSDCISWFFVGITECLAIVILNIITIIVFVKQRQLQRRSTYLIIHLAIVDLLVGAVSAPVITVQEMSYFCYEWKYHTIILHFDNLFPLTSVVSLAVISLERLHATFRPFNHRVIKKWVYGITISAIWLITVCGQSFLAFSNPVVTVELFTKLTYWLVSLFVICVSYISICIKVRCSANPQRHGATNRERKLTATLIWVTLVSLLTWLPYAVFLCLLSFHTKAMSNFLSERSFFYINMALLVLVGANSLANPVVYAIRLPEFKAGVVKIFHRAPNHTRSADVPLENL